MRTRFAPSPTGYLHLGHAYAAAQVFNAAKDAHGKNGDGTCLLRIEDIDHTRCKPEYTDAIFEDLHWLGFTWPDSHADPSNAVRRQSEHRAEYDKVIHNLAERGLTYRCFLTRTELKTQVQLSPIEQNARLARGEPYAWRLSIVRAKDELGPKFAALSYSENGVQTPANADSLGDAIIARKDIGLSYHLCVTHDDAAQGITDIVRGTDLSDSTGFHVLLQALMGWPTPRYRHHKLLLREDGQKLAKRNSDAAIRDLRAQGFSPQEVLAMAKDIG